MITQGRRQGRPLNLGHLLPKSHAGQLLLETPPLAGIV
jgi:hypothetical protein